MFLHENYTPRGFRSRLLSEPALVLALVATLVQAVALVSESVLL
jgi:hypothetical protein